MKHHNYVRNAIDGSLSAVRFTYQDRQAVLRAIRQTGALQTRRRICTKAEFLAAAAMLVLIAAPLSMLTLRALRMQTTDISAAYAGEAEKAEETEETSSAQDIVLTAAHLPAAIPESEAVRAARACFEAHCDTTVFSFEEYTVSVALSAGSAQYVVSMQSIYDVDCSFQVIVSAADGSVISHSAPERATMPKLPAGSTFDSTQYASSSGQ